MVLLISKLGSAENVCIITVNLIHRLMQQTMIQVLYNVLFNLKAEHSCDCLSAVADTLTFVRNTWD